MLQNQTYNSHRVIWREWRNCHNASYAKQLFELVADSPVGWGQPRLQFCSSGIPETLTPPLGYKIVFGDRRLPLAGRRLLLG